MFNFKAIIKKGNVEDYEYFEYFEGEKVVIQFTV